MSEEPAAIGEVIGGYQLESVLGQGGMGCVYEAKHTRLGRRTALKLLAPSLCSSDEYVSRFLSEAKIVNDVRHPNIVDIYDFIELEAPRRVAYVMELVEGPSLGGLLKERRLSLRQAINVTFQLIGALEAVHAVGVIHRDLKPDNVLVLGDADGDLANVPSVKILDFGIAKSSDADVQHKTITGSMLGTPSYMAPEQIAANPVSAATDIYAIGEIFYEMVSGKRLFRGERMRMLSAKLLGEVPDLVLPAEIPAPESVKELVRWCLALDPEERPSISELANALTELLAFASDDPPAMGETFVPPVDAAPAEQTASPMQSMVALPAPRPRVPLPLVGGIALVAAAAIAFGVIGTKAESPAPPPAPDKPVVAAPAPEPKPKPAVKPPEPEKKPAEAKPDPKPEPEPEPKKTPKRRVKRRRKPKPKPKTVAKPAVAPAPKPAPKRVVKKRELVPW